VETHFARRARKLEFSAFQRQIILGTLLGDGYLMPTTRGHCLRVNHGASQQAYVEWKHSLLADYVRTPPRSDGNARYFRTVTHPALNDYHALFYAGRRKIVPTEFLRRELGAVSLGVWFMDDGARDGNQVRLNTQSFEEREVLALSGILADIFGVEARLNRDKGLPRLRVSAKSMPRFAGIVASTVIPSMRYKLP
jgi:recombination protein RecA